MAAMTDSETITLDREAVVAIRAALLVGLASYGEVDKLCDCANVLREMGTPLPDLFSPTHPTGSDDTVGQFAEALSYLNQI